MLHYEEYDAQEIAAGLDPKWRSTPGQGRHGAGRHWFEKEYYDKALLKDYVKRRPTASSATTNGAMSTPAKPIIGREQPDQGATGQRHGCWPHVD